MSPDTPLPPIPAPPLPPRLPPLLDSSSLSFRHRHTPPDLSWLQDLEKLKKWLLVFLAPWLGGAALWILGATQQITVLATVGPVLFVAAIVPYVAALVFSYRVQDKLNKAGLYKPGAWQVVVGGLLLNPWLLGWAIPVSVLATAIRIRKSLPSSTPSGTTAAA